MHTHQRLHSGLWRWSRRKPALAASLAAFTLVFLGGSLGIAWQWRRAESEKSRAQFEARVALRNLYAADIHRALEAIQTGDRALAVQLLEKHRSGAMGESDRRGWEWRYGWNQIQSDEKQTLGMHSSWIFSVAFSPDGGVLASSSLDGTTRIWEPNSGRCLQILTNSLPVRTTAFSPDGRQLAVGDQEGIAAIWDTAHWTKLPGIAVGKWVQSLRFSPDGTLLFAAGLNGHSLIELNSRRIVAEFPASQYQIYPVGSAFSPDGKSLLFSEGATGKIIAWDLAGKRQDAVMEGHRSHVNALSFSPDGKLLASVSSDRSLKIWEAASWRELKTIGGFSKGLVASSFSPDGRMLAAGGGGQEIHLLEVGSWQEVGSLRGHSGEVLAIAFSPDGTAIASGGRDGQVRLWSSTPAKRQPSAAKLTVVEDPDLPNHALATGGQFCLAAQADNTFVVLETDSFQEVQRQLFPMTNLSSRAISHNRGWLAFGSTDGRVIIVDQSTPQNRKTFLQPGVINRLSFSPNGRFLFSSSMIDGAVRVWDVDTAKEVRRLIMPTSEDHFLSSMSVSPDGRFLLSGHAQGKARIWDWARGEVIATFQGHRLFVLGIALSIDGKTCVTAGMDGRLCVWDTASQERRAELTLGARAFWSVALSPDGERLAAGTSDATVEIWNLMGSAPLHLGTLKGHIHGVRSLSFSSDGDTLYSLSSDSLRAWRAATFSKTDVNQAASQSQK